VSAKALYFPYIKTPDDQWFTRVLLYWDAVGTIVPGNLEGDDRWVTPRMRALRDEGLLDFVRPAFSVSKVPHFAEAFLSHLEADQEVQARRRQSLDEFRLVRVHVWKLGDLAEGLVAAGLARAANGPGWELWLEVEERTANLFMAYLAVTLGALQEVAMDPVTNRRPALAALLGVDTDTGLTLKRARELRLGVLDELLPAPAVPPAPRELAEFKREHGPQLAAFRDRVDEELLRAALLPEQDAREERASLAARALLRERDDIVKLMGQRRWPRIVFGSVAGVAAAATAVAAPFIVGGGVTAAALAAPGLLPAVYIALGDVKRRPDFGRRPMAYAALADRRFAG
jgi:hypothetical protein